MIERMSSWLEHENKITALIGVIPGFVMQTLLFISAWVCLFIGATTLAGVYFIGHVLIYIMRKIERDRRLREKGIEE